MKLVIDIPEEIYYYVDTQWRDIPKIDSPISIMCNAIIDGTPLPKGHGRLIDADALCDYFWDNISKLYTHKDLRTVIDNTPTIIEADKEGNNADNI